MSSDAPAIVGHEVALAELGRIAAGGSTHALLMSGPVGTGRTTLAFRFAQMLNCLESPGPEPCGTCRACRLIEARTHPDIAVIEPGDSFCRPRPEESHTAHPQSRDIRICQVRGVIDAVARYPIEARHRVLIIEPAEAITEQAAQAFLKTLEEPPPHTVFVLIAAAPERLLETIRSRCRRIDVRPVSGHAIAGALAARGVDEDTIEPIVRASRGRPARAFALADNPALFEDRQTRLEACRELLARGFQPRFAYGGSLAERWRTNRAAVADELDLWESLWEEQLHLGARRRSSFAMEEIVEALRAVEQARADLQGNVMTRAALERMLIMFPVGTMSADDDPPASAEPEDEDPF